MTTTLSPAIAPTVSRASISGCRAQRRGRTAIIAAALVAVAALAGCGVALKLGYAQASSLTFRWLDGYVDFDDAQSLRTRAGIDEFFAWHRRTQLPDYAARLARARAEVVADTTPERVCQWPGEIRSRLDTALVKAMPTIADVIVTMSPRQIASVEAKYTERNREWRRERLQKDASSRREAAIERELERAERFYGDLEAAQRESIERWVDTSPYVGEITYAERLRRQGDAVDILRRLNATPLSPPPRAQTEAEVLGWVQRIDRSPDTTYRAYTRRVHAHDCAAAAQLHNATTPEQRRNAAAKLKGYEDDLRAMAADAG